jgi:hypothetical protein
MRGILQILIQNLINYKSLEYIRKIIKIYLVAEMTFQIYKCKTSNFSSIKSTNNKALFIKFIRKIRKISNLLLSGRVWTKLLYMRCTRKVYHLKFLESYKKIKLRKVSAKMLYVWIAYQDSKGKQTDKNSSLRFMESSQPNCSLHSRSFFSPLFFLVSSKNY